MSRIAYVNGQYVPHRDARVHVEDRGYQFADSVYEVCEVRGGRLIDEARHLQRLTRSLTELRIRAPMHLGALGVVLREVVRRNRVSDGLVYIQVSRGVATRNHAFPAETTSPSIVVTARSMAPSLGTSRAEAGVSVITVPDNRWGRVDIKTTGLLPNVLAKQIAKERGAFEAWFVDGAGRVTEGASTNAWIVTGEGELVTRAADERILLGITRTVVLDVAGKTGLRVTERAFTVAEAQAAREAFLTAATTLVMPVIEIDGVKVGHGRPGPLSLGLRNTFHRYAETAPLWSGPASPKAPEPPRLTQTVPNPTKFRA